MPLVGGGGALLAGISSDLFIKLFNGETFLVLLLLVLLLLLLLLLPELGNEPDDDVCWWEEPFSCVK